MRREMIWFFSLSKKYKHVGERSEMLLMKTIKGEHIKLIDGDYDPSQLLCQPVVVDVKLLANSTAGNGKVCVC